MILKEASATAFTDKRGQFIRLPPELRLPDSVKRVDVHACGCERIIAPLGQTWDSFFLDDTPAPEDFLPERASQFAFKHKIGHQTMQKMMHISMAKRNPHAHHPHP